MEYVGLGLGWYCRSQQGSCHGVLEPQEKDLYHSGVLEIQ